MRDVTTKTLTKRRADGAGQYNEKQVTFKTLRRHFMLMLEPGTTVLSENFQAVTVDADGKSYPLNFDQNHFFSGYLKDESTSKVSAYFEEGLLSANIACQNETFVIEPAWRYQRPWEKFTMISYRASDVRWDRFAPDKGAIRTKIMDRRNTKTGMRMSNTSSETPNPIHGGRRQKRARVKKDTCGVVLYADYYFFKGMGGSKPHSATSYMIQRVINVDRILRKHVFDKRRDIYNIGLEIDAIRIYTEFTKNKVCFNSERNWRYDDKLYSFADEPTGGYCIGILFTHVIFEGWVFGLAFTQSVCDSKKNVLFVTGENKK